MLNKKQQEILFDALYYLSVKELKNFCERLNLPTKGEKIVLIENIKHFIITGNIPQVKTIPKASRAQQNINYHLEPNTKIFYGSYKNDTKTRLFLKKLIGEHFHFTSFGQDWIKDKWFKGEPPTYAEFARYWSSEYQARKNRKATPKREWAYLNFIEQHKRKYPDSTKSEAAKAWKIYRKEQLIKAQEIFKIIINKYN